MYSYMYINIYVAIAIICICSYVATYVWLCQQRLFHSLLQECFKSHKHDGIQI